MAIIFTINLILPKMEFVRKGCEEKGKKNSSQQVQSDLFKNWTNGLIGFEFTTMNKTKQTKKIKKTPNKQQLLDISAKYGFSVYWLSQMSW